MLYCRAVWVAVDLVPLRSCKAIRKLTTMMFCRFWASRTVSIASSFLKPTRHWLRLTISSLPVSVPLPPSVTFPSVSAKIGRASCRERV